MNNRMLTGNATKPKSQHRTKSTESVNNKRIHLIHTPFGAYQRGFEYVGNFV